MRYWVATHLYVLVNPTLNFYLPNIILVSLQEWPDKFYGLWQTQQWNFLLEKAFNMVVGNNRTRCCVCSLFDTPNPLSTFPTQSMSDTYKKLVDSKMNTSGSSKPRIKVNELRVVVQRVLIKLPTNLSASKSEGSEELISCSSCGICVHKCKL